MSTFSPITLGHLEQIDPGADWLRGDDGCVCFTYDHAQDYLDGTASIILHVLVYNAGGNCEALISDRALPISESSSFQDVAERAGVTPINLARPLPLEPVYIPKPWGQEIWYSGIEERGVSKVNGTPIAWVLDVFGEHLGCTGVPLLLKILDPLPDENLGDLYFELHEQKVEVYIVTSIDENAWPDGVGRIRYGFNQDLMQTYPSTGAFLDAYKTAVSEYESVRRSIDALAGKPSDELTSKESELREAMYEFTAMRDLTVGDVVTVSPLVPHSLQHGVRVVEFQTPHYERYILSFGQKVLTQDHWDTAEALDKAITDTIQSDEPTSIAPGVDVVADFDEFRVTRLRLSPGETLTQAYNGYAMVMGIAGTTTLVDTQIGAEQAFYVAPGDPLTLKNEGASEAVILIAEDKQQ